MDISAGMLRLAAGRLPVVRADVARLPFAAATMPAVIAVMVHTDMPAYPAIVREAARVLRPAARFVHIGVHPCFCGGFADHTDLGAVVIRPGYLDGHWTKASWTTDGVRDKVGASHWPLPDTARRVRRRRAGARAVRRGRRADPGDAGSLGAASLTVRERVAVGGVTGAAAAAARARPPAPRRRPRPRTSRAGTRSGLPRRPPVRRDRDDQRHAHREPDLAHHARPRPRRSRTGAAEGKPRRWPSASAA